MAKTKQTKKKTNNKLTCHLCGKILANLRSIKRHFNARHQSNPTRHQCPHCVKNFSRRADTIRHVAQKHPELDQHLEIHAKLLNELLPIETPKWAKPKELQLRNTNIKSIQIKTPPTDDNNNSLEDLNNTLNTTQSTIVSFPTINSRIKFNIHQTTSVNRKQKHCTTKTHIYFITKYRIKPKIVRMINPAIESRTGTPTRDENHLQHPHINETQITDNNSLDEYEQFLVELKLKKVDEKEEKEEKELNEMTNELNELLFGNISSDSE